MKDGDSLPTTVLTTNAKKDSSDASVLGGVGTSSGHWLRFCSLLSGPCSQARLLSGGRPGTSTIFPTTSTFPTTTISMFWCVFFSYLCTRVLAVDLVADVRQREGSCD